MATAIALRFRVNNNTAATIQSHRFINSFSSSSSTSSSPKIEDENTTQSPPSQSSNHAYISDLKSRLQRQTRSPLSSRLSTEKPNSSDNISEIIARLSVFHRRSAAPPSPATSFEEVYKRNVIPEDRFTMSFSMFPEKKFNLRPVGPNQSEQRQLYGGEHHDLPNSVFGKEIIMKSGEDSSNDAKSKVELKQLRPEEAKGINKSFSLDELDQIRPPRSVDIMRDIIAKMGEKETSEKSMTMRDPLSSLDAQYPQQSEHLSQNSQFSQATQTENLSQSQNAPHLQQLPQLQVPQPDPQLPVTSQPKKTVKPRKNVKGNQKGRNINYTQIEDEALVRSWIAISGDGIVGNSQSGSSLWSRIYNTFNEILGIKNPDDDLDRSPNSLACRWTTIQRQVNKFCGYFATVERNPRSGSNFDDWVDDAKKAFRACENSDFKMDELWKILRDNPKWNEKNVAPKRKESFPSPLDIDDINVDSTPQSNITGYGSSTQQEDDGNHVAPNTIENGSDRPKLGITVDGSSAKAINEFVAKLDAFVQQQLAMSEKEIASKEEMHRKDQEMKERHFQQKERLLQQQAQMMRQKQWQSEKDILEKDLSGMDLEQAEMFRKMQRCIWTKWQQEGTLTL